MQDESYANVRRQFELQFICDKLHNWNVVFTTERDNLLVELPPGVTSVDLMLQACDVCRVTPDGETLELRFRAERVHRDADPPFIDGVCMWGLKAACLVDSLCDPKTHLDKIWQIGLTAPGDGFAVWQLIDMLARGEYTHIRACGYKQLIYDCLEL
jgi:hypothetical protein